MHKQHRLRRRRTPDAVTESTRSMISALSLSAPGGSVGGPAPSSSYPPRGGGPRLPRLMWGLLPRLRKKESRKSESQLRRLARKHAASGDWNAVRNLIAGHKFTDVPEGLVSRRLEKRPSSSGVGGERQQTADPSEPLDATTRRPSYGSQGRRSFTRDSTSAAAAALIKAANLDESSEEEQDGLGGGGVSGGPAARLFPNNPKFVDTRPDYGENILHDLCQFHPPVDVIETLLSALHRRRGCMIGTDDAGRTPLHIAAEFRAGVDVIRALVQADPTPASRGDVYHRSPLHLAMRYCVYHCQPNPHDQHSQSENNGMISPEEVMEETLEVVRILKEAMHDYPGTIGFKDEDASGYSPLDYAIDGDVSMEELIQALIRRRDPKRLCSSSSNQTTPQFKSVHTAKRRPFSRGSSSNCSSARSSSNCSVCSSSTGGGDIDIEVLRRLERDEIKARMLRIDKMKERRRKKSINFSLFDVFGIQEQSKSPPVAAAAAKIAAPIATTVESVRESESQAKVEHEPPANALPKAPTKAEDDKPPRVMEMSAVEIYNKHLQDYLDAHLEDCEGVLEQCDDDEFDIFKDPELDDPPLNQTGKPPERLSLTWVDDDCASVASEITFIGS